MYSIANIAVVVRDLARHPQGARLVDDLRHVLALDDAALAILDQQRVPAEDAVRRERLAEQLSVQPRALAVLSAARDAAEVAGWAAWSSALPLLDSAPMGGCAELLAWVRDDLLSAAWHRSGDLAVARYPVALDVVCDGLLASWAGPDAGSDAALGGVWRTWTAAHSPAVVTDPAV